MHSHSPTPPLYKSMGIYDSVLTFLLYIILWLVRLKLYSVFCIFFSLGQLDRKRSFPPSDLGAGHYLPAGCWCVCEGGGGKGGTMQFLGSKFYLWIHRGVTNMISISFPGIKMLWLLGGFPPPPNNSPSFIHFFKSLMPPFHPPLPKRKNMHMLMCKQSHILLRQ